MVNASLALGGFSVGKSQNKLILSVPVSHQHGIQEEMHSSSASTACHPVFHALNHDII